MEGEEKISVNDIACQYVLLFMSVLNWLVPLARVRTVYRLLYSFEPHTHRILLG